MSEEESKNQEQKAKTCKQAIQSPLLFALGFLIMLVSIGIAIIQKSLLLVLSAFIVFVISALVALILGVVALYRIGKSNGKLTGKWWAVLGVGLVVSSIIAFILIIPVLRAPKYPTGYSICRVNLHELGKAMLLYSGEYDDKYPTADKWCDLLIEYTDMSPRQFVCRSNTDAVIGESSYAFNKNIVGKKITEVPGDVVVLFETNFGKNPTGRDGIIGDRNSLKGTEYSQPEREVYESRWNHVVDPNILNTPIGKDGFIGERGYIKSTEHSHSERKVYKLRWNQVGGPEILTTENHGGKGCHISFNDGHVEFVKTEELGQLKWKVEKEQ